MGNGAGNIMPIELPIIRYGFTIAQHNICSSLRKTTCPHNASILHHPLRMSKRKYTCSETPGSIIKKEAKDSRASQSNAKYILCSSLFSITLRKDEQYANTPHASPKKAPAAKASCAFHCQRQVPTRVVIKRTICNSAQMLILCLAKPMHKHKGVIQQGAKPRHIFRDPTAVHISIELGEHSFNACRPTCHTSGNGEPQARMGSERKFAKWIHVF